MNTESLKDRFYRWLAKLLPRDLVTFALFRAFIAVAEKANEEQYHDMPVSLLFQRWQARREPWFYWYWQNLTDGKKPLWRHGRAWWRFFHNWLELHLEWTIFDRSSTAASFDFAGDEDDFGIHLAIYGLFSIYLTVERFEPLRKLLRPISMGYGYETGVRWSDGSLWIHFAHNDMWGSGSVRWKWSPSWISIWKSLGYKEHPGSGFYFSIHFDDALLGSNQHAEKDLWPEPIKAEIPIEPDNSLGLHYFGTFMA